MLYEVITMLRMEAIQKDILDGVEQTLRTEFMSNLSRSRITSYNVCYTKLLRY